MSQTAQIFRHLEAGNSITQLEAIPLCGCTRLAARIRELREANVDVVSWTVEENDKRFSRYALREHAPEGTPLSYGTTKDLDTCPECGGSLYEASLNVKTCRVCESRFEHHKAA